MLPTPDAEGSPGKSQEASNVTGQTPSMAEGSGSVLEVGTHGVGVSPQERGLGTDKNRETPPDDLSPGNGDKDHDLQSEAENGPPLRKVAYAPRGKITRADAARAIELCDGDIPKAAAVLGLKPAALTARVKGSQQLAAMARRNPVAPTETSVISRTRPPELPTVDQDSALGEQLIKANRELLRTGLEKAGIKSTTIAKLRQFDDFAHNAGEFLIAALDLSHRSMIYLMVHLLEEAERIKSDYLDDALLDDEFKIQWQQAYIDIVEQVGKCFDRTLTGTQAMARLLGTEKPDDAKKKKPGFRPLKRAEKAKSG